MESEEKNDVKQSTLFDVQEDDAVSKEDVADESFESLLKRLETIVEKMESGKLSLEESMKLYEEGIKKTDMLTSKLADARKQVLKLVADNEGEASLESFDGEES